MKSRQPRSGIVAGGNFNIDQIKIIDQPIKESQLLHITKKYTSTGGSPYNILKNLSLLKAPFKLAGIGLVGNDANGALVLDDCIKNSIDKKGIKTTEKAATSFTDVITDLKNRSRTLLHFPGANNYLDTTDFRLDKYNYKIFHLGYLSLLGKLDDLNENSRTGASILFETAVEQGFKTSANLVYKTPDLLGKIVDPSLPYIDYLFVSKKELGALINEQEVEAKSAAKKLFERGVRSWVFVLSEKYVYAINKEGRFLKQGKIDLPQNLIKGRAGEKEAIISGMLLGLHENYDIAKSLELSVATAAACLRDASCTKGVMPLNGTLEFANEFDEFK